MTDPRTLGMLSSRNGNPQNTMTPETKSPHVLLFYHRDTRNKFHGTAIYVRQFIQELGRGSEVITVAPGNGEFDPPRFSGFLTDVLQTCRLQFWAFMRMKRILPSGLPSVVASGDVYLYLIPMLIAHIRRVPIVYLCSDLPGRYAASWRGSSRFVMKTVRAVLDGIAFMTCDAVVVRTESMRSAISSNPRWNHPPIWVAHHQPMQSLPDKEVIQGLLKELDLARNFLLIFVGNCYYPPNSEALQFILRQLAPAMVTTTPEACFIIVGPGSEQWKDSAGPNVRVLGRVNDLSSLLYAAHVGLAPLTVEGGVSSKVIDYLAHGLTVLATSQAAVGQPDSARLRVSPLPQFKDALEGMLRSGKLRRAFDVLQANGGTNGRNQDENAVSWARLSGEISRIACVPGGLMRFGKAQPGKSRTPPHG